MGHNIKFIPAATPSTFPKMGLEEIPTEVRNEVEEMYTACKTNAGYLKVVFDGKDELPVWVAQVKAYCDLRPAGAIRFRQSPVRGLTEEEKGFQVNFRITDVETAEEKATREIREAAKKAEKAAKDAAAEGAPAKGSKSGK